MQLSLGPIHYYWPKEKIEQFYSEASNWPIDIVYLGETVCAKRREMRFNDWMRVAEMLSDHGKQVVISTLALLEAQSDVMQLERICQNGQFLVEANDVAAVQLLQNRVNFVIGPHINCYNASTLDQLMELGATRWVPPVELSSATIEETIEQAERKPELEIFSYGKLPLSFSARCFTARADNVGKDQCERRCINDAEGRPLFTQENQNLFTINGIQLLSGQTCNLFGEIDSIEEIGGRILRISPQLENTENIINQLADALQNGEKPTLNETQEYCNGYWFGESGLTWQPN